MQNNGRSKVFTYMSTCIHIAFQINPLMYWQGGVAVHWRWESPASSVHCVGNVLAVRCGGVLAVWCGGVVAVLAVSWQCVVRRDTCANRDQVSLWAELHLILGFPFFGLTDLADNDDRNERTDLNAELLFLILQLHFPKRLYVYLYLSLSLLLSQMHCNVSYYVILYMLHLLF